MSGYFFRKTPTDSLSDLDHLFGNTISRLHVIEPQIGYCKRLIERSRYDLRTCEKRRAERLKKLIRAAEIEIDRLST